MEVLIFNRVLNKMNRTDQGMGLNLDLEMRGLLELKKTFPFAASKVKSN